MSYTSVLQVWESRTYSHLQMQSKRVANFQMQKSQRRCEWSQGTWLYFWAQIADFFIFLSLTEMTELPHIVVETGFRGATENPSVLEAHLTTFWSILGLFNLRTSSKQHFPALLKRLVLSLNENLKSGFRACEIHPFDR